MAQEEETQGTRNNSDSQLNQFQGGIVRDLNKSFIKPDNYYFALNGRINDINENKMIFHNIDGTLPLFNINPETIDYTGPTYPAITPNNPASVLGDVYLLGAVDFDDLTFVIYRVDMGTFVKDCIALYAPNGIERKGYKIKYRTQYLTTGIPSGSSIAVDADFNSENYLVLFEADSSINPAFPDGINLTKDERMKDVRIEVQFDKSLSLYFTDNLNEPRRYNTWETYNDIKLFALLLSFRMPFIDAPNDVNDFILTGQGFLPVGSYRIAMRYVTSNFNFTNVSYFSRLIEITPSTVRNEWWNYDGGDDTESPTNKAVKLYFSNLDTSYTYLQLVVLKYQDTGVVAYVDDYIQIVSSSMEVIHRGNVKEEIVVDDVLIDTIGIKRCRTLDIVENRLILSNIVESEIPNERLRAIADLIQLEFTTDKAHLSAQHAGINYHQKKFGYRFKNMTGQVNFASTANPSDLSNPFERWGHYQNELMVYKYQGLFRDMWYSFGIQFVLKDGTKTAIFPIGRYYDTNPTSGLSSVGGIDFATFEAAPTRIGSKRIKAIYRKNDFNGNEVLLFKTPVEKLNEAPTDMADNYPANGAESENDFTAKINPMYVKFDLSLINDNLEDIEGFSFHFGEKEDEVLLAQGILYGAFEQTVNKTTFTADMNCVAFYQEYNVGLGTKGFYSENQFMLSASPSWNTSAPEYHGGNSTAGDLSTNTHRRACLFAPDLVLNGFSGLNGGYCHIIYNNQLIISAAELIERDDLGPEPGQGYIYGNKNRMNYAGTGDSPTTDKRIRVQASVFYCNTSVYYDETSLLFYDDASDVFGGLNGCQHYKVDLQQATYFSVGSRRPAINIFEPSSLSAIFLRLHLTNEKWKFAPHIFMQRTQGPNSANPNRWEIDTLPQLQEINGHYYYKTMNYIVNKPTQLLENKKWEFIAYHSVSETSNPNGTYPSFGTVNFYRDYPPDCFVQFSSWRLLTCPAESAAKNTDPGGLELFTGSIVSYITENQFNWELRHIRKNTADFYYPAINTNLSWFFWSGGGVGLSEGEAYNQAFSAHNNEQVGFSLPANFIDINQFPTRHRYSQLKIVGVRPDPYRVFFANDYRDDDLRYGEIIQIFNHFSNILSIQRQAISIRSVNMQALTQVQGQSIRLGTGDVLLQKPQYITTEYGCQHQHSCVKTPYSVYGVDVRQAELWRVSGVGESTKFEPLASQKGIYSVLNKWLEKHPIVAMYENPYKVVSELIQPPNKKRMGIVSGRDLLFNEVYFAFIYIEEEPETGVYQDTSDSFCLKFFEETSAFDSYVFGKEDYPSYPKITAPLQKNNSSFLVPEFFLNQGNRFFLFTSQNEIANPKNYGWEMNVGNKGHFFDFFMDFALTVVVNKMPIQTKVLDNLQWKGAVKDANGFDIQLVRQYINDPAFLAQYSNIFHMDVSNQYQRAIVDLILQGLMRRVERDFRIAVPKDGLYSNELQEQFLLTNSSLPFPPEIDVNNMSQLNSYGNQIRERFRDRWFLVNFIFANQQQQGQSYIPLNYLYLIEEIISIFRYSFS